LQSKVCGEGTRVVMYFSEILGSDNA